MPIYEYKCKRCGTVTECIQKFSDAPLCDCKECGTTGSLEKLMSLSAFHLKGSGWYLTDYGRKDTCGDSKRKSADKPKEKPPSSESNTSSGSAE